MLPEEDLSRETLDTAVSQVINTLKFYGVELIGMEVSKKGPPSFKIQVIDKYSKRELKDTLNIAYWILWSLVYGKYTEEDEHKRIKLSYQVKRGHNNES